MTDREQIERLYYDMYAAMVKKDRAELLRVHDESFVLVHMTGMRQSRQVYIDSILNGTLNYFSERTESLEITVQGNTARMTGKSRVVAAVYGGGKHEWRLQGDFTLRKENGTWRFTGSRASTYTLPQ